MTAAPRVGLVGFFGEGNLGNDGSLEAVLTYLRDAPLRRRHGEASRARVEREFEAKVHARALQNEMVRVARR